MPPPHSITARRHVLEPLRPALIGVSLVHLALAGIVAWLAFGFPDSAGTTSHLQAAPSEQSDSLRWFRPANFQTALPLTNLSESPTEPATAPPTSRRNSRYITLSRIPTPPATTPIEQNSTPQIVAAPPARHSLDAATLDQLDRIDEALYEAFMQAWSPPLPDHLAAFKLTARLDISITPEITLEQADLVVPSGSTDLDLSVLLAAEKVAERLRTRLSNTDATKFPKTLPSSFQNSRYVCRIQFQIE